MSPSRPPPRNLPLVRPAERAHHFDGYCFVAGLHRSGTILVETLLRSDCEVATLRAEVPENEGQHLQDVVPAALVHGGPGRFAFAPEMHTAPASEPTASAQRERLLRCWTPWLEGEGSVLVEKSPPNLVRVPWLRSVFPGARFLVVTRHPLAVAAATQKWSNTSIEELVHHWHVAHDAALAAWKDDCAFIRYEDLCADPTGVLDDAIAALRLPRRSVPLSKPDRFSEIRNTNRDYLERLPNRCFGRGSWTRLGYSLSPSSDPTGALHGC